MAEVTLSNLAPQGSTPSTVGSPVPAALQKPSTALIVSSPSSFVQLPPSLRNLFPPSSTRASYQNVDNILERQSLFSAPFLSARQAQADAWIGRVEEVALGSRSIGLLVGGAFALQAVRGFTVTQEFQMTASALSNLPRARAAWMTLPALALVGCGSGEGDSDASSYDAQGGDGGTDGAPLVDIDGDGYRSNVDCNDQDSTVHPLPSGGGVVTLNSNLTICPGVYTGLNLVIAPGTTGIRITGTGVTLDGQGSDPTRPAFQLNQVSQTTLEGFQIMNYPSGPAVISLKNAPNNTFQDMTVESPQNRYAFYIDGSDGTILRRININSHSDVGVYVNLSNLFTLTNSTITGVPPFDMVLAYGLVTLDGGTGHRIDSNTLTAGSQYGMELYNLSNSMVTGNHVQTNQGDGMRTSSMRMTTLDNNIVTGNQGWGLQMISSSTTNTITNNNFTTNTLGAVHTDASSSTGNTFSGNMPPP